MRKKSKTSRSVETPAGPLVVVQKLMEVTTIQLSKQLTEARTKVANFKKSD